MFNLSEDKPKKISSSLESSSSETDDHKKEFTKVDIKDVDTIKMGSYVKYIRTDGKAIKGGFLTKIWTTDDGHKMLFLTVPPKSKWNVKVDNIAELWVRETQPKQKKNISSLNIMGDELTDTISHHVVPHNDLSQLEMRISVIEAELREQKMKNAQLVKIIIEMNERMNSLSMTNIVKAL
jgi:hypothetical protein